MINTDLNTFWAVSSREAAEGDNNLGASFMQSHEAESIGRSSVTGYYVSEIVLYLCDAVGPCPSPERPWDTHDKTVSY